MPVSMCKKLLAYHLGYFVCLYICDLAAARRGGDGACALAAIVVTVVLAFLYRFLEVHVSGDILRSFHGGRVGLSFNSTQPRRSTTASRRSKYRSLHGRYGRVRPRYLAAVLMLGAFGQL